MLVTEIRSTLRRLLPRRAGLPIEFVRRGAGFLASGLPAPRFQPPAPPDLAKIEELAALADELGPQPLWDGYAGDARKVRTSNEVRSNSRVGCFYAWLAAERKPSLVVEFGTAFGVSGMYWLSGLKRVGQGRLLTFEPNAVWAGIAKANLARIAPQHELVVGTFESEIDAHLRSGETIDIAFIDAIHTSDFVFRQLEIVLARASPGALILFDDIDFSDDMRACWQSIARREDFAASASVGQRLGIVELRR